MASAGDERQSQDVFLQLKAVCVPLLGSALLSTTSIPRVSGLLDNLNAILLNLRQSEISLTNNILSYVFFPLSTILRRNNASDIPDRILEKVLVALKALCGEWWWHCDLAVWNQLFMLCTAVIGGIDTKDKGRIRDDETRQAAGQCLVTLLYGKFPEGNPIAPPTFPSHAQPRLKIFQEHTRADEFLPILGQAIDTLLTVVETPSLPLQRASLQSLTLIVDVYAPDHFIPSVLPGIVSRMTKLSLGVSTSRGWANGDIVAGSLQVMQCAIVKAVGDDICVKDGAIQPVVDLEGLAHSETTPNQPHNTNLPFITPRTPSWLRGTASQLLIALNTLTSLVLHPTASALRGLSRFSARLLSATSMTLPDAQPLFLYWLLSLSNSDFASVSDESRASLISLLASPSIVQHSLQKTLIRTTSDNLLALPRLLSTRADAKVEHAAGIVEATCRLASSSEDTLEGLKLVSIGIGKLLGPSGRIEKWGWNLLSVIELVEPSVILSGADSAQLMLESGQDTPLWIHFPDLELKNTASSSARSALERMLRALGQASGDGCLFAVEWFSNVGRSEATSMSIAATWCACRLLEGVAGTSLSQDIVSNTPLTRRSKRVLKLARTLARNIAELWDESGERDQAETTPHIRDLDDHTVTQYVMGINPIPDTLRLIPTSTTNRTTTKTQPGLHRALLLQLLATSAGVLRAHFIPLFIYTLYPVLRSLVSSDAYLSSTALATLNHIATVTSYASPANLLLSNFDYALDAVSRRLSRRWLDVEATKVLTLMVRLVGGDIVERAADVVEECFDRLDEFHGYGVIVEGLVGVLGDVVHVIREDFKDDTSSTLMPPPEANEEVVDARSMDDFFLWFTRRRKRDDSDEEIDYSPAPREAWGNMSAPDKNENQSTEVDSNADPPVTPIQALSKQIVSRSLFFLTHGSSVIRARILSLLSSSITVLPESAILPSIHHAWPFILNRFSDPEPFVVSAAASLVEELAVHTGSFMFRRIWDDVWPRYHVLLRNLDLADATNALARRGHGAVGTESAYTYSHRTYRAVIKTMTAAVKGIRLQEASTWQLLLDIRRFLHKEAHEELQTCARNLYLGVARENPDVVWLVLSSTMENKSVTMQFLVAPQWDIQANAAIIFQKLERVQLAPEKGLGEHQSN